MKTLVSILALALAFAVAGPAFAGNVTNAKTAADCAKAGGVWDSRIRRTWFDKLSLWRRAYETKIFDGSRERGPTPEADLASDSPSVRN